MHPVSRYVTRKKSRNFSVGSAIEVEPKTLTLSEQELDSVFYNLSIAVADCGMNDITFEWGRKPNRPPQPKNLLFTDSSIKTLETMRNLLDDIIDDQNRKKHAVKIQAQVRGYLVRKNTKQMYELIPQVKISRSIFLEFLTNEKSYLNKLHSIIKEYLLPLRSKATESEELQDIVCIFSNLESIAESHERFHNQLLGLQDESWPVIQGLGRLFLEHTNSFKKYGEYAQNFTSSIVTVEKLISQKKNRLREILVEKENGAETLQKMLRIPIQRIEKYETVIGAFLSIPHGLMSDEFEYMSRACSVIQGINEIVKRNLKFADRHATNMEIERSLVYDRPFKIAENSRYLIMKGHIYCSNLKKLYYFLFNNLLLLTKQQTDKVDTTVRPKYKLLYMVSLLDVSMTPNTNDKGKTEYKLTLPNTTLELVENKKKNCADCETLASICEQINNYKRTGSVFGLRLSTLLDSENANPTKGGSGIPGVVTLLTTYLRENAIKTEGLLRLPGNFDKVELLRKQIEAGSQDGFKDVDLSKQNPHDVAEVLRGFFRDLPEPVIPFHLYEPLVKIQKDASLQLEDRIEELKSVIIRVPIIRMPLLKHLVKFLQDVEGHSETNKMTVANLAIVFAPNLIKPKIETIENALEMPLLQGIIQILIEHAEQFWDVTTNSSIKRSNFRKARVLSRLIVGEELRLLDPNHQGFEEPQVTFRSLARPSPGYENKPSNDNNQERSPKAKLRSPKSPKKMSAIEKAKLLNLKSRTSDSLLAQRWLSIEDRSAKSVNDVRVKRVGSDEPQKVNRMYASSDTSVKRKNRMKDS